MPKYQLVISQEADHDLDNLYTDGFSRWGENQADQYYDGLLSHFEDLCENPYHYRAIDEIRVGYRRSVYGKHSVFYRIVDGNIEIQGLVKYQNRYFQKS